MSDTDLNMNVGLRVDTSGEELIDRLRMKIKALEASLKSINANIARVAKSAASTPGSAPSLTTAQNQKKQNAEARKSARDLFQFRSRLEAQRQHEADRSEQYLHRLRVNSYREQERAAAREMKARLTGEARIAREHRTAQADAARASRAESQALRDRMSFVNRMAVQRQREEAAIARESARHDRARARDFRSGVSNSRSAASHGRDSYDQLTRTGGAAAAIGTAATASLARRALLAETDIDAAEINARIYANLTKDAARQLRDQWAAPLAEQLGVGTAKLLSSYTDAIKVGIPTEGARQFSALATQTSEAWGVQFEGVVDILGTVNSILTSTGDAFDFGKLKGVANAIQYLSAKQSTTPEKLISYLQRGAGAAQILGMSQEAGLAFGSASTSLGNQAAESGRLADFVAGRIVSLPDLVKKQGLEGTRARELIRHLGYGSAGDLDRQRRADPDAFLPDFVGRFNAVKDTKKQEQLLKFFAGTEWFGEFGRIVKGFEKYKEAADLAKESKKLDAIGEVWSLHRHKLAFVFKQISSGFLNILGEIGKVLSPMARQIGDYFLAWSRKLQGGGLQARVKAAVEGFIEGFGFRDLPDLLKGIFGEPGQGNAGAVDTWRSTAKAFAEGIRDTLNALKGLFSVFTGSNATLEVVAKWTGRLLTFAAACVIAAPVVAVLSGLASGITALAVAAFGAWRIMKAAGLVGSAAGASGVAGKLGNGAAAATGSGLLGSIGRWLGLGAAFNATAGMSKEDSDALMMRLGEYAKKHNAERERSARDWIDPPARSAIEDLRKSIDDNTLIHKQNFESQDGFAGLIRKANMSGSDVAQTVRATIQGNAAGIRFNATTGSIGGGIGGSGFTGLGSSTPGSALGNVGIGGRGIIGGGGGGVGGRSGGFGGSGRVRDHGPGASDNSPIGAFRGSQTFDSLAPRIMADLKKDFGLSKEQAAGILGNLGHESGGFRYHQEVNPVGGGRGGIGWAQWTGPRRRAYEAWCAKKGLDPRSYEANYSFLRHELQTSEKGAIAAVRRQSTVQGSMVAFENGFERAGVKAWGSRAKFARRAMGLPDVEAGVSGPTVPNAGADVAKSQATKVEGWQRGWGGNASVNANARRAVEPGWKPGWGGNAGATDGDIKSTGWKPGLGGNTPLSPQRSSPAGSSSNSVSAPITINGANQSPEQIANAVQRKLQESMNRRTHDLEPTSVSGVG